MSDYFGALMNLSGPAGARRSSVSTLTDASPAGTDIVETEEVHEIAGAPRSPASTPTHAPAAGTDIVETDEVREIAAGPASLPSQPGSPAIALPPGSDDAAATVVAAAARKPSLARAPAATDVSRSVPLHAESVPASRVAPAPIGDERNALIRAAREWVAADPRDAALPRDIDAAPPRRDSASPSAREEHALLGIDEVDIVRILPSPRTEVPARLLAHDVDIAATGTSSQANAALPARVVRVEPPQSARSPTRFAPVAVPDEIVEISIGAIHVHVDAPQTLAQAPPAAPSSSARMPSERSAASSALARRALRRI